MADVRYDMWADYVQRVASRFGVLGKELLDLACGTGNTSFTMAQKGYRVTGVDGSADMLRVAESKRIGMAPEVDVQGFVHQDLRELSLDAEYDLVTCLFDSLNYILDLDDLASVFGRVRQHLKPHGVFVFDVNTEYQLAKMESASPMLYEKPDDITLFWRDEWEPDNKIWRIHLDGFIKRDSGYERVYEMHEERAHSIEEIEDALLRASFHKTICYDAFSFAPPRPDSGRLHFVVRI